MTPLPRLQRVSMHMCVLTMSPAANLLCERGRCGGGAGVEGRRGQKSERPLVSDPFPGLPTSPISQHTGRYRSHRAARVGINAKSLKSLGPLALALPASLFLPRRDHTLFLTTPLPPNPPPVRPPVAAVAPLPFAAPPNLHRSLVLARPRGGWQAGEGPMPRKSCEAFPSWTAQTDAAAI